MSKRPFALLCLLLVMCLPALADGPTLVMTPDSATVLVGSSQLFSASFSDGSHIRQCVWNSTGIPPNSITPVGATGSAAVFGAGTSPGSYVVTAVCTNTSGVSIVANAAVTIPRQ